MGLESTRDLLERKVQFALELIDPITGVLVSAGVKVEAIGADGKPSDPPPVVNRSGRFVWIDRGGPPPEKIVYDPGKLPYAKGEIDLSGGLPKDKLVGVKLRPNRAYAVAPGVTTIRGRLFKVVDQERPIADDEGEKREPIPGAVVQLAWGLSQFSGWIPPAPAAATPIRPGESITDKDGEFIVFARLPGPLTKFSTYVGYPAPDDPAFNKSIIMLDIDHALPRARLQVTLRDISESRATPATFKFLDSLAPGRIPEGRLLPRELELDWDKLDR